MTHKQELPPPKDDGLVIPEVGDWSKDKHHFLQRYLDAFTTAMKDKQWQGLHYIDLFAGAGIERLEKSRQLDWGSPLLAAQTRYPFTRLHLCEMMQDKCEALRERVGRFSLPQEPQILYGDVNKRVAEILAEIPEGTLSLAFLDPYGLHLDFATVELLSRHRSDLIVFFPDHLDALRNWELYEAKPNSNLDRFMGTRDWPAVLRSTPKQQWAEKLRDLYLAQLKTLGYAESAFERICVGKRPLYLLIFCSRHRVATKLWRRIASKHADGQRLFDFGGPE